MYRVMLVEDEHHLLNYMKNMLIELDEFEVVGAYDSPEEALLKFPVLLPEVVFLDIEMPILNGIEVARRMLHINNDIKIIFTTAYSNYSLDAFEVEAIDYLLKPIGMEDINRVITRLSKYQTLAKEYPVKKVSDTSSLPVRCFGRYEVRNKEDQIVKWPTKKTEEVFAYLLTHQQTHISKWSLVDMIWPDMEEDRGLNNLYNTISRIKSILNTLPYNPVLKMLNSGYILEANQELSDYHLFMSKEVHKLSIEQVEELFYLYKSPLFGIHAYSWSVPYQRNLVEQYQKIYKKLLSYYQTVGDIESVENMLKQYTLMHIEEEDMLVYGLQVVRSLNGAGNKLYEIHHWLNDKLKLNELPEILM